MLGFLGSPGFHSGSGPARRCGVRVMDVTGPRCMRDVRRSGHKNKQLELDNDHPRIMTNSTHFSRGEYEKYIKMNS